MSTRSQVHFINSGVYLYQHHDGYDLPHRVQNAISKNVRWNDEEYLTRIVFDSMKSEMEAYLKKEYGEEPHTGYGIGTSRHGDIEYLVTIDCAAQQIEVLEGFGNDMDSSWKGAFEDYSKLSLSESGFDVLENPQ